MSDLKDAAKNIFEAGREAGDSRDSIIVSMVQGGISLNSAQNWYKDFAVEAGIHNTRIGHKKEAMDFISNSGKDLANDSEREELKLGLREEFGVANSTVNDYIKAYANDNGIELPKSNFGANPEDRAKIFDWLVDNKDCSKTEFKKFMVENMGRAQGSIDETWRGVILARDFQEAGVVFGE